MKLFKWLDRLAGLEGIDELHEQAKRQLEDARKQLRTLTDGAVLYPALPMPGLVVGAMHYGSREGCEFDECAVCETERSEQAKRRQQLQAQQQAQFLAYAQGMRPFNMNSLSGQ